VCVFWCGCASFFCSRRRSSGGSDDRTKRNARSLPPLSAQPNERRCSTQPETSSPLCCDSLLLPNTRARARERERGRQPPRFDKARLSPLSPLSPRARAGAERARSSPPQTTMSLRFRVSGAKPVREFKHIIRCLAAIGACKPYCCSRQRRPRARNPPPSAQPQLTRPTPPKKTHKPPTYRPRAAGRGGAGEGACRDHSRESACRAAPGPNNTPPTPAPPFPTKNNNNKNNSYPSAPSTPRAPPSWPSPSPPTSSPPSLP
jgi:hypothetical protein